jgi:3-hydroxymyristoyl/3-hydroxydecanoyl-(acyl carrier protein) dehydratase
MNHSNSFFPSGRLQAMIGENAQRAATLHRQFLQTRRDSLQNVRALIEMQINAGGFNQPEKASSTTRPALFGSRQLDEFGTGKLSACLGPAFAKYDTRRIPRIPNGDLKMMSRITAISGCAGDFNTPASVVAEYDVPVDAWYLRDSASPQIPTSLWMEIALQPCGFLSAYLDTYALVPYGEFQFRNLDGSLRLLESALSNMDLRGRTLTTRARMLSNVVSGGTVIQKFAFEITCAGRPIYDGESIFGYFSLETMANQAGLDGGRMVPPALRSEPGLEQRAVRVDTQPLRAAVAGKPFYRLGQNQMQFLDDLYVVQDGGRYGKGYVYASQPVDPQAWYYPYHFYQDPVMPGSLGVEAILEAMQGFALATGLGHNLHAPSFTLMTGSAPMTWRYRGQITQQHKLMEVEAHLSAIEQRADQLLLLGDASLWVNGLRIYEVKNAAVGLLEGR